MDANRLTFDESSHTYRYDGRVVPSVTQILGAVFSRQHDGIPPDVLARKSAIGTATHKAIELQLLGQLDHSTLHDDVRPYFDSWAEWFAEAGIVDEYGTETQFYSPLGYCGTVDFGYCLRGGGWGITDWKTTSSPMPTHALQLTAYAAATEAQAGSCLYLRKDGKKAKFVEYDVTALLPDWLAVLRVYTYMEKTK